MTHERAQRLGNFLRARRLELGLSARHVARAVNVRDSTIMRLERGCYAAPAPDKLARIAEILRLELADVFALAEYLIPSALPELPHYLRARYPELTEQAIRALHDHLLTEIEQSALTSQLDPSIGAHP